RYGVGFWHGALCGLYCTGGLPHYEDETQEDLVSDELRRCRRYEFRTTGNFIYISEMEKDIIGMLPYFVNQYSGTVRACDCRCTGGADGGSPGNHWSQLYCSERHIYRGLVKRKWRFLQYTGIYDRGHDPGDCLGGRHPGI